MVRKIILFVLIAFALVGCKESEAVTMNEEAFALYEQGDYEGAIDLYNIGLEQYPEFEDFYSNRGMVYHEIGEEEKALADLNQAILLKPTNPEAYANRGAVYMSVGMYQEALTDLYAAIGQKDAFLEQDGLYFTYLNLGTLLNHLGQTDEAMEVYQLALELNDQDHTLYNAMGMLTKDLGNYEEAISYYNQALDLDQNYAFAYANRGNAYYGLENFEFALSDANTALSIDPYIPQAYDLKARALFAVGRNDEAKKTLTDAMNLWVSFADLYVTAGNIYLSEEDYGQALSNYGLAVKYGHYEGHMGQAIAYRLIGQYEDALASLKAYEAYEGETLAVLMERGMVLQLMDDNEGAIEAFQKVQTLSKDYADAYYYEALSREYLGAYQEALTLLEKVLSIDPDYTIAQEEIEFIQMHFLK